MAILHETLATQPTASAHYTLALVYQDLHEHTLAIENYRSAIAANPNFIEAYNNLALVLEVEGQIDDAIRTLTAAVHIQPAYYSGVVNLGRLHRRQHAYKLAYDHFLKASSLQPDAVMPRVELGRLSLELNDSALARHWLASALGLQPDNPQAHRLLGRCRMIEGQAELAYTHLQRAIALGLKQPGVMAEFADACALTGRIAESRSGYARALVLKPTLLRAIINEALTLPMVYDSQEHLLAERHRFARNLESLIASTARFRQRPPGEIVAAVRRTNFFLAYQGMNDRDLQVKYGAFVQELIAGNRLLPSIQPIRHESTRGKLRIGFASRYFKTCTVGKYFQSWITRLDKSRFEIFVYAFETAPDQLTRTIQNAADTFRPIRGDTAEAAAAILNDALDLLVYPEIGMDPLTYLLACQRLAPVQCCGWGHPVTTGLSTIDYFISCAGMEPDHAQEQYSERLVLLPGIGTVYDPPGRIVARQRADFGLPDDRVLYLVPQSLFKLHPDNDALFVRLLSRCERALLVLFKDHYPANTERYLNRLESRLHAAGLNIDDKVRLLEPCSHEDYLSINALCDVMLDSLHWSGGNTTLDALASGLPIVTLPGEFMRGRQTAAMLNLIGVPNLVVENEEDYLALAVELGVKPERCRALRSKILEGVPQLFKGDTVIHALEAFFQEAWQRSHATRFPSPAVEGETGQSGYAG
ncbi:MAG: tetratricopeptide repeat protein [Hydrogenophilales bacterium]|nr:tetratricopeptide repeat protein [Hydrogenophilales bacterium]